MLEALCTIVSSGTHRCLRICETEQSSDDLCHCPTMSLALCVKMRRLFTREIDLANLNLVLRVLLRLKVI